MQKVSTFLVMLAAVLLLTACEMFFPPPIRISVSFSATQYDSATENGSFPVLFPAAAGITTLRATVPNAEIASHGPVLGGTIAVASVTTNRTFYITGARIENVRYRLSPESDGSPIGTSSEIAYIHPVYGLISPLILNLAGTGTSGAEAVIAVKPGEATSFDIGIASALSFWDSIDSDRDGVMFPVDDNEEIEITGSIFFEGFLLNGTEFSGSFPPPLFTKIIVRHDV